jgi:hypothetical protein
MRLAQFLKLIPCESNRNSAKQFLIEVILCLLCEVNLYYKERRQLKTFLTQFGSALPLTLDPPVRLRDDQKGGATIKITIWGVFLQKTNCFSHLYLLYPPVVPAEPTTIDRRTCYRIESAPITPPLLLTTSPLPIHAASPPILLPSPPHHRHQTPPPNRALSQRRGRGPAPARAVPLLLHPVEAAGVGKEEVRAGERKDAPASAPAPPRHLKAHRCNGSAAYAPPRRACCSSTWRRTAALCSCCSSSGRRLAAAPAPAAARRYLQSSNSISPRDEGCCGTRQLDLEQGRGQQSKEEARSIRCRRRMRRRVGSSSSSSSSVCRVRQGVVV